MGKVLNANFEEIREGKELMGDAEAFAKIIKDDPARACDVLLAMLCIELRNVMALQAEIDRLRASMNERRDE